MNMIEDSILYKQCSDHEKKVLKYLKNIFNKIQTPSIDMIEEKFEINADLEGWWYSYVRILKSDSKQTQDLNKNYIDYLVNQNYIDDIENKIIARFESGEVNGI